MRLYLVRHGQTDMNKRNMFSGWTDADKMCIRDSTYIKADAFFFQIVHDAAGSLQTKSGTAGKDNSLHSFLGIDGVQPVSYTHLDVYKRQEEKRIGSKQRGKRHGNIQNRFERSTGKR